MQTALEKKPNLRQQECIDTLKGSIMVLAGPGTGKTYTLIERIKNMLAQKITPSKILCLTFSDAAANEMKKRLVSDIGPLGAEVNVYTYHSFCNEIINNYPDDFVDLIGARIISDATKRAFLRQCIDEIDPKALRTENYNAYYYIPEIIKAIEEIKKNLISKDKFFSNLNNHPDWKKGLILMKEELEEKLNAGKQRTVTLERKISELELKIEKSIEIWKIYERYCELMQENNLIDFSDMINSVLKKFQLFPAFASKIANEFEYFLVDEYQDTNKAQNLIIFHLVQASNEKNIFVVGDDDQIIYGFQGAQIDNVEKFLREFPKTKVICLNENMRSTQSILDYSYEIIKKDTRRLEINPEFTQYKINKKLVAKNLDVMRKDRRIKFNQFEELEQEQNYITNEIENLIKSNDCPIDKFGNKDLSQIAILTKTNSELYAFGEKLKAKNIPYELKEGKNIFEIKSSIMLILYMKLIVNPVINSDKLFTLLLNKPFNINPKDYEKLLIQRQLHKNDFFIDDIKEIEPEKFEDIQLLENITQTYDYLKKYSNCENLKNTVLEIVNKTGILKYFLSSDINRFENIMGIKKIIEEAQGLTDLQADVTLENFVEYLTIAAENNINMLKNKNALGKYRVENGKEEYVRVVPVGDTNMVKKKSEQSGNFSYDIKINSLKAPLKVGDNVGTLTIKENDNNVKTLKLTVTKDVEKANFIDLFSRNVKDMIIGNMSLE